jgi:hypothetical protein
VLEFTRPTGCSNPQEQLRRILVLTFVAVVAAFVRFGVGSVGSVGSVVTHNDTTIQACTGAARPHRGEERSGRARTSGCRARILVFGVGRGVCSAEREIARSECGLLLLLLLLSLSQSLPLSLLLLLLLLLLLSQLLCPFLHLLHLRERQVWGTEEYLTADAREEKTLEVAVAEEKTLEVAVAVRVMVSSE